MALADPLPGERYRDLLAALEAFEVPPRQVQVLDPAAPHFDATRPLIVLPPFEAAREVLERRYPSTHRGRAVLDGHTLEATLETLPAGARAWCLEPLEASEDARSILGLRAVMERLYGPEGCPWDRSQTHETLRKYLLEECYELVDAIDLGDRAHLREELGDLLAHVFMHTAIAQEAGEFSLEDVVEGASRKFVRRHPHVFGDESSGSNEELLRRWEEIKAAERAERGEIETVPGALDSVPLAAPALQRAQSLQGRAHSAGALEPELEPMQALARAVGRVAASPGEDTLGTLLWAAVRVARDLDVDAEEALRARAAAFTSAFRLTEDVARASGVALEGLTEDERRGAWSAG